MTRQRAAILLLCAGLLAACESWPARQGATPSTERAGDTNSARTDCIADVTPTDCRREHDLTGNYPFGSLNKGDGGDGGLSRN